MEIRRLIDVEIIPGQSLTRFHLALTNPRYPDPSTELHVAHHADGDLSEPCQWYNIYEHPTEHQLALVREHLNIDEEDWGILEHMLGSFRWVIFKHPLPDRVSEIRVDEAAMRSGEWTTTYF